MAYMVSPGIQVKEFDISGYVPGVSASVGAIGGVFSWGPSERAVLISNEGELISQFGLPTDDNFETFMIASNFLAYSSALYVSRATDSFSRNAIISTNSTRTTSNVIIKNYNEFPSKVGSLDSDIVFMSRFPGKLGNGLSISVCASSSAFESDISPSTGLSISLKATPGSSIVELEVIHSGGDQATAKSEMDLIIAALTEGDFIKVGQHWLQISSLGSSTPGANPGEEILNIGCASHFPGSENATENIIKRRWAFATLFDRAPGTSEFTSINGGDGDEFHLVVIDLNGKFTGTIGQPVEIYSSISRAFGAKTLDGGLNYYKDIINDTSNYIYINTAVDIPGITSDDSINLTASTSPVFNGLMFGGANSNDESNIALSSLASAYDIFKSREHIDVSLIIAGKATGGANGEGIGNYIIDNIADIRKDCIVCISPPRSAVVGNTFKEVDSLIAFRNSLRSSGRGFLTSSYKLQYDRYNRKNRWIAGCGDDAGLMARTDMERDAWWSPAGENRGKYKNIIRLAFSPNQAERDELYKRDVNPVINLVGSGIILYGDKTLLGKPSSFDRINVRRLFDVLEKAIERYARELLFEFNDIYTRSRFINSVEPFLRDVMGRRGIIKYKVLCDETNNTPAVINRNEFVGSIYIVPSKSINFITLNFVAVASGVDFSYAIGEVDGISNF